MDLLFVKIIINVKVNKVIVMREKIIWKIFFIVSFFFKLVFLFIFLLLLVGDVCVNNMLIESKENLIEVGDKNDLVIFIVFVVLFEWLVMFNIVVDLVMFILFLNIFFDLENNVLS